VNMLNLPEIIKNKDSLYDGDLTHYFQSVINNARNLKHPYHNFRHMFHVTWLCYDAGEYYFNRRLLDGRQIRNLLIAAMFHDFDHSGRTGNDDLNIELAIRGLKKHLHKIDEPWFHDICTLIKFTEFPHKIKSDSLSLSAQILRDADLSQGLSPVWVQEIIFGLSSEMCVSPIEVFKMQQGFFSNLRFHTDWALSKFPEELIQQKIKEANDYVSLI